MRLAKKLASNKLVSLMKKRVDKAFKELEEKSITIKGVKFLKFSDVEEKFRTK